jgi:hypothetical protein
MVNPVIIAGIVLLVFVFLDTLNPLFSDLFILVYFLFAYINIDGSKNLATFYLFSILAYMSVRALQKNYAVRNEGFTKRLFSFSLKGRVPWIGILVGIGLFFVMRLLQGGVSTAIIGVPSLAISNPGFSVSNVMLLGAVENRFFFTVFEVLRNIVSTGLLAAIPVVGGVLSGFQLFVPVVLTSVLFSIFHLTAFSLALSSMIFASMVFILWLISYIVLRDDLSSNTAHMFWNASTTLGRLVSVA